MAEKIKIDTKPIDKGMEESGTKAEALDAGATSDAGPDLDFGSGAAGDVGVMESVSGASGSSSTSEINQPQQADAQQTQGTDGTDDGLSDLDGGDLVLEHGTSIPPPGFENLEQQESADGLDADLA